MKRKLIIMLVTILLILTNVVVVFAETTAQLAIKTDKSEVKPGDTFTVTIGGTCKDGIGVLNAKYTYNSNELELISQKLENQSFMDLNAGLNVTGDIAVMGNSKIESSDLYSLTFKVKDGVESGTSLKINFAETHIVPFDVDTELVLPAQEMSIKVAADGVKDDCEHTYGEYADDGNGSHSAKCTKCEEKHTEQHTYTDKVCSVCGAGEPVIEEKCEHTYGEYTDDGNGSHSAICTKCEMVHTETHVYTDKVCSVCGAEEPVIEEKCEHTYGEYKDDGNDSHSAICTKCEEKNTGKHEYKDGVCSVCKAKEVVKDETVVDKVIPQAGLNTMLGFGVVAIVAIGIIMCRKNKQYKDIK